MNTGTQQRIGILGGSFNPIHIGHLILAQDALEQFELSKVVFVPCCVPPHKPQSGLAAAEDRLRMLELALEGDLHLEYSNVEMERGGVSYTVDTLRELSRVWPEARLFLVIGADSLPELHLWKDVGAILSLCQVVTLARPGSALAGLREEALHLPAPWPKRLLQQVGTGHLVEVSSTEIRRRVAEGMSIRFLVPSAVEMYIAEHGLYMK